MTATSLLINAFNISYVVSPITILMLKKNSGCECNEFPDQNWYHKLYALCGPVYNPICAARDGRSDSVINSNSVSQYLKNLNSHKFNSLNAVKALLNTEQNTGP